MYFNLRNSMSSAFYYTGTLCTTVTSVIVKNKNGKNLECYVKSNSRSPLKYALYTEHECARVIFIFGGSPGARIFVEITK